MTPYRLRIPATFGGHYYITRDKTGTVRCFSGGEMPEALSNIVGGHAAELRFALEDAEDAEAALAAVETARLRYQPNAAGYYAKHPAKILP